VISCDLVGSNQFAGWQRDGRGVPEDASTMENTSPLLVMGTCSECRSGEERHEAAHHSLDVDRRKEGMILALVEQNTEEENRMGAAGTRAEAHWAGRIVAVAGIVVVEMIVLDQKIGGVACVG